MIFHLGTLNFFPKNHMNLKLFGLKGGGKMTSGSVVLVSLGFSNMYNEVVNKEMPRKM